MTENLDWVRIGLIAGNTLGVANDVTIHSSKIHIVKSLEPYLVRRIQYDTLINAVSRPTVSLSGYVPLERRIKYE